MHRNSLTKAFKSVFGKHQEVNDDNVMPKRTTPHNSFSSLSAAAEDSSNNNGSVASEWPSPLRRGSTVALKTIERTFSKLRNSSDNITATERELDPIIAVNIAILQTVIADRTSRQTLITNSVSTVRAQFGFVEKIRFCSCVEDFKTEKDQHLKLQKARKIISIFIESGSMFQCSGVTEQTAARLRRGLFEEFDPLVTQFLEELAQEETLMANCTKILDADEAATTEAKPCS